jgi:predicted nuclease of predicted toxin-antitoxin system
LNGRRPKLRVFLDEGVPTAVAKTFKAHGHDVVPFEGTVKRGSQDALVCRAAEANDAILVAFDKDMKAAARRFGIGSERFKRLSLIHFQCPEPMASMRLEEAMSFVEHEWSVRSRKSARQLYVDIATHVLRSHR